MVNIKPEAANFYKDFLQAWIIDGLKTIYSKNLGENFIPGLACFVATEAVGRYLPPLKPSSGSTDNQKYFYRCLFRLQSEKCLRDCDNKIRKDIGVGGIYQIRNGFVHKYIPNIGGKGVRIIGSWNNPSQSKPIMEILKNKNGETEIDVNVKKYVEELEYLLDNDIYDKVFNKKFDEYISALNSGYNNIFKDKRKGNWRGLFLRLGRFHCRFQVRYNS